jgi:O-antigen ligase
MTSYNVPFHLGVSGSADNQPNYRTDYSEVSVDESWVSRSSIFCALVGFFTPFTIKAAGNLPIAEWILFFAVCSAIVIRFSRERWPDGVANSRIFFGFIVLQVIGLLAYIVSDLYRESASRDFLRGWARMIFVGVDLLGLATLIGTSWRRLVVLKLGFIFGVAAEAAIFGPLYGAWWKFGFALPVTLLVLILVGNRNRWVASSVAVGLGLLNFSLDYRSLGAECFIVAVAVHLPRFNTFGRLVALVAMVTAAIYAMVGVFHEKTDTAFAARHESDSERRAMVEAAANAFAESPIIGHGSWFSNTKVVKDIENRQAELKEGFQGYTEEQESVLTIHSQMLTALAEGGFFGASFFFGYAAMLIWAFAYALRTERPQQILVIFLLVEALWNLAMTPFSGPKRIEIATAAVLTLMLWQESRGRLFWRNNYA